MKKMVKNKKVLPELDATEKELCLQYINDEVMYGCNKLQAICYYRDRNKLSLVYAKYQINAYIYEYKRQM